MEKLQSIEITKCVESPTNPRGTKFDGPEFDELVASIKEKGVLMPVLARPTKSGYEIVAGNRRYRAAKKAGLTELPARIVEMTDTEVREAQIVENLQRADVPPLDEAEAYRQLIETSKPRMEIAVLAKKVGKSESYIRQRLVLTELDAKVAAKVRSGELPVAHGMLIARLDKAKQTAAFKFATDGGVCSVRELRDYVAEQVFADAMKNPPWKDDAQAKAAIAQVTGLKGGEKNLFGEDAADKFENPADYARAMAAYLQLKIDEYQKAGKPLTLVSGDYSTEMKGIIGRNQYQTGTGSYGGKCKSQHEALVVEGRDIGKLIKICTDRKCPAHYYQSEKESPAAKEKARAQRKKERQAEDTRRENSTKALTAAVAKMKWPLSEKHMDVLIGLAIRSASHDVHQGIVKRRELALDAKKTSWGTMAKDYEGSIKKAAAAMKVADKPGLLFELLVPGYSKYSSRSDYYKGL